MTLVRGEGAGSGTIRAGSTWTLWPAGRSTAWGTATRWWLRRWPSRRSTLIQASNQFYTVPQLQLAELLVKNSCLDRVFFCNSGAEANEGAVKLARRYGKLKLNGAYEVITALNSFHGRTLAMTAATGQPKFQEPYMPLPAGFVNVAYNDIEAIKGGHHREDLRRDAGADAGRGRGERARR